LDGEDVTYIARSAAQHRLLSIAIAIGTRLPAAYTSMGRVILANLPKDELTEFLDNIDMVAYTPYSITDKEVLKEALANIKAQQYAVVDQELDSGLRSLALPVYKSNNELIGAINISTNAMRVSEDALIEQFLPLLKECADNIQTYYI